MSASFKKYILGSFVFATIYLFCAPKAECAAAKKLQMISIHAQQKIYENIALEVIPVIQATPKKLTSIKCENLKSVISSYADEQALFHGRLTSYLAIAAGRYLSWDSALAFYENKIVAWDKNQFETIQQSSQNIASSSDAIYQISNSEEEFSTQLTKAIQACVIGSTERDAALDDLNNFRTLNLEHLIAVADFLAQMTARLDKSVGLWVENTNSSTLVPPGYFSSLLVDQDIFIEATHLVAENAGIVGARYHSFMDHIMPQFLLLAPL